MHEARKKSNGRKWGARDEGRNVGGGLILPPPPVEPGAKSGENLVFSYLVVVQV